MESDFESRQLVCGILVASAIICAAAEEGVAAAADQKKQAPPPHELKAVRLSINCSINESGSD